jgi:hypothetical protein
MTRQWKGHGTWRFATVLCGCDHGIYWEDSWKFYVVVYKSNEIPELEIKFQIFGFLLLLIST